MGAPNAEVTPYRITLISVACHCAFLLTTLSRAKVSSDAELNSLYQDVRKRLDEHDANRLIATEKLWIQYRDANCEAERALYGLGTGAGPAYLACLEAMTRERTKELRITYTVTLK